MPVPSVEKCYDSLAGDWDAARQQPSPTARLFSRFFRRELGSRSVRVLDAGCGNCRNSIFLAEKFPRASFWCVDFSQKMVEKAEERVGRLSLSRRFSIRKSGVAKLPFSPGFFDAVISIAVLHHLSSKPRREAAFREMFRVLKPGGVAFATVWNKNQPKFRGAGRETLVAWKKKNGETLHRYYYFYSKTELASLAAKAGFQVVDAFFEKSGKRHAEKGAKNLCLFLRKPVA